MAMLGKKARQLYAVLIVTILGIWCASCSHGTEPARQAFGDTAVGIFTPRDPINIGNRHSPNSWDALYSDIRQELMQQGFSESAISHTSSSGIEDQSRRHMLRSRTALQVRQFCAARLIKRGQQASGLSCSGIRSRASPQIYGSPCLQDAT